MKVVVYNFKGGVGKTAISLCLALQKKYAVITNDIYSPIDLVLDSKYVLKLTPEQELPDIPDDYNVIYDFGGYIDKRTIRAIEKADFVIIPTISDFADVKITLESIKEIENYNKRIVIIINNYQKDEYEEVKQIIDKFYNYPTFPLKKSKLFKDLYKNKVPIAKIANKSGLNKYIYQDVNNQFEEILKFINL